MALTDNAGSLGLSPQCTFFPLSPISCHQPRSTFLDHAVNGNRPCYPFHMQTQSLMPQGGFASTSDIFLPTELIDSSLGSLLSPEALSLTTISNPRMAAQNKVFGFSLNRLLIFSIENNFAGLEGVPIGAVLKFLAQDAQLRSQLLKYLRATPKSVAKTLAEKLVRAAIENCDAATMTELLNTDLLTPDEIVCTVDGVRYTAVERSAMLRSIEVTEALLKKNADVNKTYSQDSIDNGGALELAVRDFKTLLPLDMKLINMILACDAEVKVSVLNTAIRESHPDLVRALMSKLSPSKHSTIFEKYAIMVFAVEKLDSELATMFVVQIVQACSQTGCYKCLESTPLALTLITMAAARRGYSKLVTFLLFYTTNKEPLLAAAIHSGQKDMVKLLLDKDAPTDAPAYVIEFPTYLYNTEMFRDYRMVALLEWVEVLTTPLAEAVRAENTELRQALENRGALSQINEEGRFSAAILEAAEVGDLKYIQKILSLASNMNGKLMTPALNAAIRESHEDIALFLLEHGVNVAPPLERSVKLKMREMVHQIELGVDYMRFPVSSKSPLLESIQQKNALLVSKILECDIPIPDFYNENSFLVAAIKWGEISVIKDLLAMGLNVNNGSEETPVIAAVRTKNRDLVDFLVRKHSADLNKSSYKGESPLETAISIKDIDMFHCLLDLGADPSHSDVLENSYTEDREALLKLVSATRTKYPAGRKGLGAKVLHVAMQKNDIELVDLFLEAKFDVNEICWTRDYGYKNALGVALVTNCGQNLVLVKKLLSAGSDPNGIVSRTSIFESESVWSRRTALLQAILTKSKALVELLINAGADIHRTTRLGVKRRPLQYACEIGSIDIVSLLLDLGVDVNEAPAVRGGGTSLQLCAIQGYAKTAVELLKRGANVHAMPSQVNGRTALEGAAGNGRLDMLSVLWDAAASQKFDQEQCDRAIKLAEENGHLTCRDLLRDLCHSNQGFIMPDL